MEIEIHQKMMGTELRNAILEKYGSRKGLEAAAKARDDIMAPDDLFTIKLFEEKPSRLDLEWTTTSLITPTADELRRLTPKRLALLKAIYDLDGPMNVRQLARSVGRDKKNVSEDLRFLEDFGLIDMVRGGREARPVPKATEIRIILRRPDDQVHPAQAASSREARGRRTGRKGPPSKKAARKREKGRTNPSR